jgi:hypothetical protein
MIFDAILDGVNSCFNPIVQVQFYKNAADVIADRFFAEDQLFGDDGVGFAKRDLVQYFQFSLAQLSEGLCLLGFFLHHVQYFAGDG